MILLDSTDLIAFLRGLPSAFAVLTHAGEVRDELATSVICVAQVLSGIRAGEVAKTSALLRRLHWLEVTGDVAQLAGELKRSRSRRGVTLQLADCLIAATSILEDCALATANRKDFPMPEIRFYESA